MTGLYCRPSRDELHSGLIIVELDNQYWGEQGKDSKRIAPKVQKLRQQRAQREGVFLVMDGRNRMVFGDDEVQDEKEAGTSASMTLLSPVLFVCPEKACLRTGPGSITYIHRIEHSEGGPPKRGSHRKQSNSSCEREFCQLLSSGHVRAAIG